MAGFEAKFHGSWQRGAVLKTATVYSFGKTKLLLLILSGNSLKRCGNKRENKDYNGEHANNSP
jgi:hypothetical protein